MSETMRESAAAIEQAATAWVLRLDRHGATPELQQALDQWLAGDSRRRGAYLRAQAAWLLLDKAADEHRAAADAPHFGLSRRRLIIGGATALAASLGGVALFLPRERYRTSLGEIRRVPLADGTTAAINTQSLVDVAYEEDRRLVRLERGEAWFQVAKDPARPFLVEAGRIRVQAVGTAFSVRRRDKGVEVLVSEGVVEAWCDGDDARRLRLAAGARAFITEDALEDAPVAKIVTTPSEVDRALAWRAGKIDLAGETLSEAIAEFNRYNKRQIILADPGLASQRFFGIFRTDDPEAFAMAVRQSLQVPIDLESPALIRIG